MSFDRLAPHYRWMETVLAGNLLQRCRTRWLSEATSARRALLAGEGHGRMLEACADALPGCEFTVLDSSAGMIDQARRRCRTRSCEHHTTFIVADLRDGPPAEGMFDLVVTNFFLDCFAPDELARVIHNLGAAAAPTATWLLSDFTTPRAGWRRLRARMVLALAYGVFRAATGISARRITSPDEGLRAAGFTLGGRDEFNHGLLRADVWRRVDLNTV